MFSLSVKIYSWHFAIQWFIYSLCLSHPRKTYSRHSAMQWLSAERGSRTSSRRMFWFLLVLLVGLFFFGSSARTSFFGWRNPNFTLCCSTPFFWSLDGGMSTLRFLMRVAFFLPSRAAIFLHQIANSDASRLSLFCCVSSYRSLWGSSRSSFLRLRVRKRRVHRHSSSFAGDHGEDACHE